MVENDFKLNGYELVHALGHGVGLDIHELPAISSRNDKNLKQKMVIYLYYAEGYSVKEISGILKISENAVKKRMQRGRKQLYILCKEAYK